MYKRIKELREDKNLSQLQVAKVLFISRSGYSKYETGKRYIPVTNLIKLAQFYDTSTDYILGLTDYPDKYE